MRLRTEGVPYARKPVLPTQFPESQTLLLPLRAPAGSWAGGLAQPSLLALNFLRLHSEAGVHGHRPQGRAPTEVRLLQGVPASPPMAPGDSHTGSEGTSRVNLHEF